MGFDDDQCIVWEDYDDFLFDKTNTRRRELPVMRNEDEVWQNYDDGIPDDALFDEGQ
jgi:hypothetical protein